MDIELSPETVRKMKENAGVTAADALVKSGMKLGLGTGSTAVYVIRRIGKLLAQGDLRDICAFATSFHTEIECEKQNIPFYPLNSKELSGCLDLTIDGADEIDPQNRIVKGGGGALLLEKIAAYSSAAYAVVADESKRTENLGMGFPVSVEVLSPARAFVFKALQKLDARVTLREMQNKTGLVITEHGNLLLDICFNSPVDPVEMEHKINMIPGVIENGFFTQKHPVVYIGRSDGTIEIR
ncbi:MAG: ribose-5-phosphate isomerase RpiA [Treponema sp.]|nr:ribose-5-phosphate isomerase RpiA [Treponema sp.]